MRGVFAPVLTPFIKSALDGQLRPDAARFIAQCQWLQRNQVGLAVFGTNSEANSMTVDEKAALLDGLVRQGGVDPARIMPGTGACAMGDTMRLTKKAVELGCGGVLMLPPFYYKGVTDEGLYRFFSSVIEAVGDERLRVYLYHIPAVSGVPISLPLLERLLKAYPKVIAGIKDSGGDWEHTQSLIKHFGKPPRQREEEAGNFLRVFAGSEAFLLQTLRAGGQGCISATANVNPRAIHELYCKHEAPEAELLQERCNGVRDRFAATGQMIAAMKAAVAHFTKDKEWERVRPPLVELEAEKKRVLLDGLLNMKFQMPGLRGWELR